MKLKLKQVKNLLFNNKVKMEELKQNNEEKVLLNFLKQTREGEYAKIDESSLLYLRIKECREPYYEEEYYYSVR